MDVKVLLLWKGAQPICTYCKKIDHWKYQCEELKKKIEKKLKRPRISSSKTKKKFVHEIDQNEIIEGGTNTTIDIKDKSDSA
ncbi:hypothetical protein AYI70_g2971 [Smittium culicis]|uniref:CCHC-type domain-containing protein n=1 Tax=Smittium culicis TaxID=133412 RepID=A0A1R1Y679_9FUNG|nr:hypothetical protein AYI70_g2971 [Smittium culicis]